MKYKSYSHAQELVMQPRISNRATIIALIIFFPLGVLLLIWRLFAHTNYTYLKIKDCKIGGTFFLIVTLFLFIADRLGLLNLDKLADQIEVAFPYALLSILFYFPMWIMRSGLRNRKKIYRDLVSVQQVTSIENIAQKVKKRDTIVYHELLLMIGKRELSGYSIDSHTLQIMPQRRDESMDIDQVKWHEENVKAVKHVEQTMNVQSVPPLLPKTVTCSSCGATAQLNPGVSQPCEYCGSVLQYL